jgi:GTPase SAR1 family protein
MPKERAPEDPSCQVGKPASPVIEFPKAVPPPPSRHPIPGYIHAYTINLLAGASGVGKSALLASLMAVKFRDALPIFGHPTTKLPAIGVINADRDWESGAGEWFRRAGFSDIRYYSMADDPTFDPRRLRRKFDRPQLLIEFIGKLQLPKDSLVFVDPISLFLGGNLLDYDTCACACHEIRKFLKDAKITSIDTAHSSKLKADQKDRYARLQDRILGSTALLGYSDTQMYLAAPEETGEPFYTFLLHSHLAPAEFHQLARDEQGLFVPYATSDEGNCTRVLLLFPDDGTHVAFADLAKLANALPLSIATLKRVIDVLITRHRVTRVKHGVYQRVVPQREGFVS